jgi:7-cyano-7-deazaguanine synthase
VQAAWAEVLECQDIFIGVNALDYSGYPDCRKEYIKSFEVMANLATKQGVEGKKQSCTWNLNGHHLVQGPYSCF